MCPQVQLHPRTCAPTHTCTHAPVHPQVRLQADLEELFDALDRAKGQATGTIPKEDLRAALLAYYKVGRPCILIAWHPEGMHQPTVAGEIGDYTHPPTHPPTCRWASRVARRWPASTS